MPGAPTATGEAFQFGKFSLNLSTRTLTRDGKPVPLTTGEFSVLKVLVQHPRLRKIVEEDPSHPKHIQTVWGFGYVFVPE